ncbi:hypothetical protein [Compostibacter hankyongensis]|uniref:Uncharacterized protein n=1 Tax=Compostibacter hankyongensis TaxID=1007089 RepID=A0ABP8FW74_9BACT
MIQKKNHPIQRNDRAPNGDKNIPDDNGGEKAPDQEEEPVLDEEDLEDNDLDVDEADEIEWEPAEDPDKDK